MGILNGFPLVLLRVKQMGVGGRNDSYLPVLEFYVIIYSKYQKAKLSLKLVKISHDWENLMGSGHPKLL